MILDNESQVTDAVLEALSNTPNPRLREIMASLIRHIHAFLRETRPTEAEYYAGLKFITELGLNTDADRNETIIAADTLGFSTLATLLNNTIGAHRTDPALLGPFWRKKAPRRKNGDAIVYSSTPGPAVFVSGRVLDTNEKPIPDVEVDVWHASPVGFYENQDPDQADYNLRGLFTTDSEGRVLIPYSETRRLPGSHGWTRRPVADRNQPAPIPASAFPFHGHASRLPDADYPGVCRRRRTPDKRRYLQRGPLAGRQIQGAYRKAAGR